MDARAVRPKQKRMMKLAVFQTGDGNYHMAGWLLPGSTFDGGQNIRRWVDAAVSRLVDIWMAFPPVLLSILLVAVLGAGLTSVIVAIVVFIWTYKSDLHRRFKAMVLLREPRNGRRFLVFACMIVIASLPSDIFLTSTWISYLKALRQTVVARSGEVAFEDTPLSRRPHVLLVENWALPSQSVAVRSRAGKRA